MTHEKSSPSAFLITFILTFARLAPNMGRRVLYPFVPAISRLLGVSVNDVQTVIALQGGMGLFSPVVAPLTHRYGRKRVMLGALGLFIFAGTMGAIIGAFWAIALTFLLFGASKMIYDPAFQAYLSDKIPYEKRAQAIGITELSWAGALVIGAPFGGLLLENIGLSAVFAMMLMFAIIGFIFVGLFLPSDMPDLSDDGRKSTQWRALFVHPQALGALMFVVLIIITNEMFFINYGLWMEQHFGLSLGSLGAVTVVIALAEIVGESSVIAFGDTFGKKRMALIGAVLCVICHVILPMLTFSLPIALIGLFVFFLAFEVAIVSFIPILSEILPTERALMLSASTSASAIGRMGGAWAGGILYGLLGSLGGVSIITMVIGFGAVFVLWRMVQE